MVGVDAGGAHGGRFLGQRGDHSMRSAWMFGCLLGICVGAAACGKDANTQMCLDDYEKMKGLMAKEDNSARQVAGGAYQACGISCDVTKDKDACAAFEDITKILCEKEGQEECQRLCEGSNGKKNETACGLVKK